MMETPELKEQRFTILYADTGYSYESIMRPDLAGFEKSERSRWGPLKSANITVQ